MSWPTRSLWIAALAVAYAAVAGLWATGGDGSAWVALLLPLACGVGWRLTAEDRRGDDTLDPGARSAARLTIAGASLFAASRCGANTPGFVAGENLGVALSAMGSLWAIARIKPLGGLAEPSPSARRLDAAAFAALFWVVAAALPGAAAMFPERTEGLDPLLIDYATVAASIGSLSVQLFAAARLAASRRAEIGVAERAQAALWLGSIALAVGILAAAARVLPPERVLPIAVVLASLGAAFAAASREPETVLSALRLTLATTGLVAPIALGAVYTAHVRPAVAGPVAFGAAGAAALAALVAQRLAHRAGPGSGRLLPALQAAARAAMTPDPEEALRSALFELRGALGQGGEPPSLYRFFPAEQVSVDRAGFMHTKKAEMPPRLVALADAEPERILRIEVMHAVSVRKPEVRPLIAWLEDNHLSAVSVVRDADGPIGALTVPAGARVAPSTLSDVRALRQLSDRLAAVLGVSSMLSRSRERELVARDDLDKIGAERARLATELGRIEGQFEAVARSFEQRARVALYSPAAQAAVQRLEQLAAMDVPVTLLSSPGIDAVAWAALVHLASARKKGVMVIVDGTTPSEHDPAKWQDRVASPLARAAGGTLVLLDAHVLPELVQMRIASGLPADVGLVVALPGTVDSLAAGGKLAEPLADRLGDRAVALPALASRGEDLSLLVLEALTRIGKRLRQAPLGIDPRALAALVDYEFPGNDAELEGILFRAALAAPADARAVTLRELETAGFMVPPGSERRARGTGPLPQPRKKRSSKT
ncbi:hypothetical protein [Polyangium fumosum]|uniref:Sigma-54 factor interaction domain-containing protein n=1 Tax=Polyangium fumosum TaxID=889272 RepID=A0A4U1JEK8_9BACT|nr:hypothetical protein [Polyangium fumosum]TKD09530.1 hypothetical protein E8A74_12465 [Polyangium fumosum]